MRKTYLAKQLIKTRKLNLKQNFKNLPQHTTHSISQLVDPYQEEESQDLIKSSLQAKQRVQQGIRGYRRVSEAVNTTKQAKLLNSKYVRKGAVVSNNISQNVAKKTIIASTKHIALAAKQLVKKLAASLAANPKVWLVGAVVAIIFIFYMTVTESMSGVTGAASSMFLMDEDVAIQYKTKVDELNAELQQQIEQYNHRGYDDVRIEYMNEEGSVLISWAEILSIIAVKYEQELDFSAAQQQEITDLYKLFYEIKTNEQTYSVQVCTTDLDGETTCNTESRTRLIVKVYTYDMEQVFHQIGFDEDQQDWARRLLSEGSIQEQFPHLLSGSLGGSTSLTEEERAILLLNLDGDIEKARRAIIETAITLEGKVGYFWGGKSPAGWNSSWGSLVLVTAPGSDSTGTYQPFGMDCSGFIDWVFKSAGLGNIFTAGGTSYQWSRTSAVSKDEMVPGDLIFKDMPGQGGVNHIGIYIGKDQNGANLYIHCQGGTGVIINSYKGFKYPRRPLIFES